MRVLFLVGAAAALLRGAAVVRHEQQAEAKVPAFDSVLTMLDNLVKQLDTEGQTDEADYRAFQTWFGTNQASTSASIGMLSNRLQELAATIAGLRARQGSLTSGTQRLDGELNHERDQLTQAQQKRSEEHESYVKEQSDFDNSIAACDKATELLAAHYGDGKPKESTKPAWMSLAQRSDVRAALRAVQVAARLHHATEPHMLPVLLQASYGIPQGPGSTLNSEYQDQTGSALGIVAQIKELGSTFADDKQEASESETDLAGAFATLLGQKQKVIATLSQQLSDMTAVLNQVNQEVGENENAEQTAQGQLQDQQKYLSAIESQERDLTAMYTQRQKDRTDERNAVQAAVGVLMEMSPKLLQMSRSSRHAHALLQTKAQRKPALQRASELLSKDAAQLHSALLATAAATTGSGSALGPVVEQLEGLLARILQQGDQEEKHKEWCENEMTTTGTKKAHHDSLVEELNSQIEDTTALIGEKQQQLDDTAEGVKSLDAAFQEQTTIRGKAKADYEAEHSDYVDAITALNQAIDILGDFYREQQSDAFVQVDTVQGQPYATDTLTRSYAKSSGGSTVVSKIKGTRQEFEAGKKNVELFEQKQVEDFETDKSTYDGQRSSLVDAGNRLSAEWQTAKAALASKQDDLQSNTESSASAANYLTQLSGSCQTLLDHFADRKQMRADEHKAISDAVGILRAV